MSARRLECTIDEYFADPCETPSLSSSIARTLATRSPAHAFVEHPRFGNLSKDSTDAMSMGEIVHRLLLGRGAEIEVISGYDDFKTKAAREERDAAKAEGRIPILEHKYADMEIAARYIRENMAALGIELDGESEIPIEFTEPGNHGDVRCRCMIDHLKLDRGIVYDVKKIRSADMHTRMRHAYEYGMDIQHAAYTSALTKLVPALTGRIDFQFLFVELDPPFAVVPARPSGMLRDLGESRWHRAVALWEQCLRTGYWPSYTERVTELDAPGWALHQEEALAD